jgi:acetoin utilization deacetylase AcuC-like enzyme
MQIVWNAALSKHIDDFISLRKPKEVLKAVYDPRQDSLVASQALGEREFNLVHDPAYVWAVLNGKVNTGFSKTSPELIQQVCAANGVMLAAVAAAQMSPGQPVMAPVSGFHHAHFSSGYGYCTFNGLLVAIAAARLAGKLNGPVLIIDGDGHYGDGTDDCIRHNVATLGDITNLTSFTKRNWRSKIQTALAAKKWSLILYQAGADAHKDDPYEAGYLDDHEWGVRDEMIFEHAALNRIPLAWDLAGGYNGAATIELHARTAQSARAACGTRRRLDWSAMLELHTGKELPPQRASAHDVIDQRRPAQSAGPDGVKLVARGPAAA